MLLGNNVTSLMQSEMSRHDKRTYHQPTTASGNDPDSFEAHVESLMEEDLNLMLEEAMSVPENEEEEIFDDQS